MTGAQEYFGNLTFSPDGHVIAGGGEDNAVRLWSADTGEPMRAPLTGHEDTVTRVAFSPDGHWLVSMSHGSLRLWDTSNWQLVEKPQFGTNIFASLSVSPAGGFFVTSGAGSLQRWDINTGEKIGDPMPGHSDVIDDVAVSTDGRSIISGSNDTTLRFWDAKSGLAVGDPLTVGPQSVTVLTLRADRRILSMNINHSPDETVSAWVWPAPAAWHDDLCKKLSYNMSDSQWADWVSSDIKYRELCGGLPKLGGDG